MHEEVYLEDEWVCKDGSEQVHVVMQSQGINKVVSCPCNGHVHNLFSDMLAL